MAVAMVEAPIKAKTLMIRGASGAAGGGISRGTGGCNNASPGHNGGRDKTLHRRQEGDIHADERLWSRQAAPVWRGSTV